MKEQMHLLPDIDDVFGDKDDDMTMPEMNTRGTKFMGSSHGSISKPMQKRPKTKGPMDAFFTPNPDVVVQSRKGKQIAIDATDPYKKEMRDRAIIRFSRWMYNAGIAFNAVNCFSFGPMIESIGQYGPGLKPPHLSRGSSYLLEQGGRAY